jgi:hypothetical protein
MSRIFDVAFDRSLRKTRKENETDPVADYNRKALIKAVACVAVGCAATVALTFVTKAINEDNLNMSE